MIEGHLISYGYEVIRFKVTDLMKSIELPDTPIVERPADARYNSYINYANEIRKIYDDAGALAVICCAAIRNSRRKKTKDPDSYLPRHAYIFDQFKRKEEFETLRQVYGRLFVGISIYSEKSARVLRLAQRIAEDQSAAKPEIDHLSAANKLIGRDEDETSVHYGQRLRDLYPLSDVFVDVDAPHDTEIVLSRFFKGFFGSNDVSPTVDEYGMYIARAASLRSLDLSRQVGAAVFSSAGEILSLGCNEVPKAGGGAYWTGDPSDARDFRIGHDENDRIKRALLSDAVARLFDGYPQKETVLEYVKEESSKKGSSLRNALVMDILEFGRIIHAEMAAITDAARLGNTLKDSTLYCTTFPCHICAKHIIAAGIKRVVFVEPYPKSYAEQLHSDSIVITAAPQGGQKIQFAPFIGVAPIRFRDIFERDKRKSAEGKFQAWTEGRPKLIVKYTVATYIHTELALTSLFDTATEKLVSENRIKLRKSGSQ